MSKVIGILSGKGGVGKTTVVANLGASLTKNFDRNIIILDSNISTSHLGIHLGLYEDLPVTLREVLKKKVPITYAIYVHPPTGIRIIPAPMSGNGVNLSKARLNRIVNQLKHDYEIVILDCAPSLGKEAITAIKSIDQAIVITNPDFPAVTDALKTVQLLKKFNRDILGIVVNRVRNEKYELTTNEIESTCGCNVISIIPEDKKVAESISKGIPLVLYSPNSSASVELKKLSSFLIGEEYSETGLWNRIKRFFSFKKLVTKKPVLKVQEKPKEEVLDVEELRKELSKEVKDELKKELLNKLRKRLREKQNE